VRLVWRGVLRFGVQAAPKVQRAKGRGWGRLLVTGKGEEPRRQGHTPSKRWVKSRMETLQQLSQAGSCSWLVRLVFPRLAGPSQASQVRRQFRELLRIAAKDVQDLRSWRCVLRAFRSFCRPLKLPTRVVDTVTRG
jgi:hypothetical protein